MATDTRLTILSQALKLEQEGRAFYLKAADEAPDDKGRDMFISLADDEKMHAEIILQQLHKLEGEGKYVLLPDIHAPAIDLAKPLFPPERRAIEAKVGRNPNMLDALHVALEAEIKSYDLYREAATKEKDPAGKEMYRWLTNAELTHYNLLMSNYEALVASSGWV